MRIDIDGLAEAELIDLNNRVVERLKFLRHMRAHSQMLEFSIGDRVSFQPEGRPLQVGMLTRYNKKTVTVIIECDSVAQEISSECIPLDVSQLMNLVAKGRRLSHLHRRRVETVAESVQC